MFRTSTELVVERSIRDFTSKVTDLTNRGYYASNGGLVVSRNIKSLFPLRITSEYIILMQ